MKRLLKGLDVVRRKLQEIEGERQTFTGEFVRLGKKSAYRGPDLTTILLRNVRDQAGKTVAEHLWFNLKGI